MKKSNYEEQIAKVEQKPTLTVVGPAQDPDAKILQQIGDDAIVQVGNVVHVPLAFWQNKALYRKAA